MATLSHAESRRLYSWWWDSHISPKNSKWLQENLTDMDIKVKAMIKLIEEDADSFRKKAEMYYRKRPELMKLVEEFYRAYRALAERYDHATGALRQAHRTMAEAFPDQIPLILPDESPAESHTPEMFNDVRRGDLSKSSNSNAFKRNGIFSEENNATTGKEETHEKFANRRARKVLNFQNGDEFQQEVQLLSVENQDLKNQIAHESQRADNAEAKCRNLEGAISKLESEKEAILLQYQLSQEKISRLEADISSTQEDVKKLNDEMLVGVTKWKDVDDRYNQLEQNKQSLQLELDMLKEMVKKQEEELDTKKEELEKVNIAMKEEHERFTQAEKLHSQSQEEVKVLSLGIQNSVEKLRKMEMIKVSLEEEILRLKEEIRNLNEQIGASAMKIKSLQDEISLLKESKRKLEAEVGLHVNEKESLQQDKNDLEQRHNELKEKIGVVNLNVASLQAMVKELRDGNVELKELCMKHAYERVLHLENLKFVEKITEQNAALEFSMSSANVELKELREKVRTLEESCETLHQRISMHISEKAVLVSQIEAIALNMENLSKKNTLLENSLSDVNFEIEGLRGKFNLLEGSCHSLNDLNSTLLAEKSTLVNQVESISCGMEDLESRYTELEGTNLNLEKEKDHTLCQATELQHALRTKNEEYETLMQSTKNQLATLENHICTLQDKGRLDDEALEVLHHKIINVQIEIFVLQRILHDMKENNILVSDKYEKYLEASMCQEQLISELKHEIEDLKTSILDSEDENQHLILEKSVFVTLLEKSILDMAELQSAKNVLECESKTRFEELLVLQSEKHQLLELNEQLQQNVQTCNQREEALKIEMEFFCNNLSDLQEVHSALQSYMANLIEENQSFAKKVSDLTVENDTLEERNIALVAENMNLEHLSLVFRNHNAERAQELQLLSNSIDQLCGVNSGLEQELKSLNEKLAIAEVENMDLKELLVKLEAEVKMVRNTCHELNLQFEIGKNLLLQKEMELSQVNDEFQAVQEKNTELSGNLDGAQVAREELQKKILTLMEYNNRMDNEVVDLHRANDMLNRQLGKLLVKVEEINKRENQEAKYIEAEIETLLTDIQTTTISAAVFEDKMLELLITCENLEISALLQKDMFYEEIARRNAYEDKLREKLGAMDGENRGLKEELSAYLPLLLSFGNLVASLERSILSLANDHSLSNQEKQDISLSLQHQKSNDEGNEGYQTTSALGIIVLEKLHAKVKELEKVLVDIVSHPEHKRFASKATLQAAVIASEGLKSKGATYLEEALIGNDVILHLKKEETGEDNSEEKMKDVQLDHVVSSSRYENGATSYKPSAIDSDETNNQMMELWETVEEDESERLSSKVEAEKKSSIDKLELTKEVAESHQERSRNISERLSFDAQRLSILQRSAKELKSTMENSELNTNPTSFEFKKVKGQLKEAEAAISHLIDTNNRLTKKAGKLSSSSETGETGSTGEGKFSERVRRGSEKVGRLELELQKLEYIWLKLKEEHDYKRARASERRTRVLLRDYLYGRRESPRRNKVCCCACIRPRTKDGYSS